MLAIKTLNIGSDQVPAQFPIFDYAAAQSVALAPAVEQTVALDPGFYEIRGDVAFAYTLGAAAIAGAVRLPVDAGERIGLAVEVSQDLALTSPEAATIHILPAALY